MDDETFLSQFETRTLPFTEWTHRAHVKVAFLYLSRHGLDEAIDRIRVGIQRYNAANDVPQGPGVGYSETMTVAFMRIVHATMQAYGRMFPAATADEFCDIHPHLLHRTVLRLYYSPLGRRDLAAEEVSFVEPDMAPLPCYRPPTVRRAVRADAAALAAIGRRVFPVAHEDALAAADMTVALDELMVPARYERELDDPSCLYWIAEHDAEPCGYVRLVPGDTPGEVELTQMYVETPWLGHGVGSALLDAALAGAVDAGHTTCRLFVVDTNTRAIDFYTYKGFTEHAREHRVVGGSRPNGIVMTRVIAAAPGASP